MGMFKQQKSNKLSVSDLNCLEFLAEIFLFYSKKTALIAL